MKVLLACEESGAVRDEFTRLGHDAISCDLQPSRTEGKHYQGDVFDIINNGFDLMVAFPPCTHLAVSGAMHFEKKIADGRQQEGVDFFMRLVNVDIPHIAIENPIGIMSRIYREPDQIIQPWWFGDPHQKSTCLWLKNLPKLRPTNVVDKGEFYEWTDGKSGKKKRQPMWYAKAFTEQGIDAAKRSKIRSKTFQGIAEQMAAQWNNADKYYISKQFKQPSLL